MPKRGRVVCVMGPLVLSFPSVIFFPALRNAPGPLGADLCVSRQRRRSDGIA